MSGDDADLNSPSDSASPGPRVSVRRVVDRLDEAACMELLANGGVGRLVYTGTYGPMALPVEYKTYDRSIVFRTWGSFTEEDLRTGIAQAEYEVALEADNIDLEAREGWTVLVRGAAHHLDTETERASVINTGFESWIEGEREHFIQVNPTRIWGNRIRRA